MKDISYDEESAEEISGDDIFNDITIGVNTGEGIPAQIETHPPPYSCGHKNNHGMKYSESARGKNARENLKVFHVLNVKGYYRALEQQGVHVSRDSLNASPATTKNTGLDSVYGKGQGQTSPSDLVQLHSRHRNRSTPPATPDGFWDLTVPTPEDWKKDKHK